jgi:hypothetical protein
MHTDVEGASVGGPCAANDELFADCGTIGYSAGAMSKSTIAEIA